MQVEERELSLRDGRNCVLRSLREEDAAPALRHLKITAGESAYLLSCPEEITFTEEEERAFIRSRLASPDGVLLGAFVEGTLAAIAAVNAGISRKKTAHRGEFSVSVYRAFWGLGVGGALTDRGIELAAALGLEQLELSVFSGNTRAMDLYRSRGFAETGRRPRAFRLGPEKYEDEVFMVKMLNKTATLSK